MDALQLYSTGLKLDLWFQGFHQPENFIFDMKFGTCQCHIPEILADGMSKKGFSSPLKKNNTDRTQTQDQNNQASEKLRNTHGEQLRGMAFVFFFLLIYYNFQDK